MCSHERDLQSHETIKPVGAQNNGGSTSNMMFGRQNNCDNMTGILETAKLAKCKMRLNPDGLLGTHSGQRHTLTPFVDSHR
jgi:hypothetical protein